MGLETYQPICSVSEVKGYVGEVWRRNDAPTTGTHGAIFCSFGSGSLNKDSVSTVSLRSKEGWAYLVM